MLERHFRTGLKSVARYLLIFKKIRVDKKVFGYTPNFFKHLVKQVLKRVFLCVYVIGDGN